MLHALPSPACRVHGQPFPPLTSGVLDYGPASGDKCEDQMYPDATVLQAKIKVAKEQVPTPCAPQVPRQTPASCRWRAILYVSELLLRGGHPRSKVCPQGQQRQRHAAQPKQQAAQPRRQHRAQAHLPQLGC